MCQMALLVIKQIDNEQNRTANGGVIRSDKSGQILDAPVQAKKV